MLDDLLEAIHHAVVSVVSDGGVVLELAGECQTGPARGNAQRGDLHTSLDDIQGVPREPMRQLWGPQVADGGIGKLNAGSTNMVRICGRRASQSSTAQAEGQKRHTSEIPAMAPKKSVSAAAR